MLLYDADPIIVAVWEYLLGVTSAEILALPDLEADQSTDDLDLPQEARWMIGFWLNRGSATPKKVQTAFSRRTEERQLVWSERARVRIADTLPRIARWSVAELSFENVPTPRGTYFVDPPYSVAGKHYRYSDIDYPVLAAWVKQLPGLAIVCEQQGADWLPFTPLASIKSTRGRSEEVIYTQGDSMTTTIAERIEAAKAKLASDQAKLAELERKAAEGPKRQGQRSVTEIRELMMIEAKFKERYGVGFSGAAEIVRKGKKDGVEPVVATGQLPPETPAAEAEVSPLPQQDEGPHSPEVDAAIDALVEDGSLEVVPEAEAGEPEAPVEPEYDENDEPPVPNPPEAVVEPDLPW